MLPFDVCGPLPDRRDRPRGQRRHRQDLHDRRARRPLRGRGHAARRAAARHLHPHGHRGAARAGAGAARERRAGPGARARGRRARAADDVVGCWPRGRRRGRAPAATGSRGRSPTSTPPRSPPPTASARRCSAASGSPATSSRDTTFVEDIGDLVEEVVDDLYVRRFHGRRRTRRSAAPRRPAIARIAIENPAAPIVPARRAQVPEMRRAPRRSPCATELERAQAPPGGDDLRRPADPPRRRRSPATAARPRPRGCAPATASCSSTSSRTPTRCSGTSSGAPSATATRRSS